MTLPALARPFRLIAFDWDGTAVANRAEDASRLRGILERLLHAGVRVVVITGTHRGHLDRQLADAIRAPYKRRLHLATNRGSEVFGFDERSAPVVRFKRTASAEEDRLLTEIAQQVRELLIERTGLEIRVISDRLNRRKIDLIPEWEDPPKSMLPKLVEAVEARLTSAGLTGGLREAFELTERVAREAGLTRARITSDVKHLEVGLTDKADSIRWALAELAAPHGIANSEVLIGGDEFGPIAGFPGSDSKLLVPEAEGAVVVSVGPEPAGAPAPVIVLGGGPARFCQLLAEQAALHPVRLPGDPVADPGWRLVDEGFVLAREHEIESLFALGNGYLGTRASLAEGSPLSAPATFIAGLFEVPFAGAVPELASLPDWARIAGTIEKLPLRLFGTSPLEHRRVLDLRQGVLWRDWRHQDQSGRITHVRGLRLASLADRHLILQSVELTAENYTGQLEVERPVNLPNPLVTQTGQVAALDEANVIEAPEGISSKVGATEVGRWTLELQLGKTYRFDRMAVVRTSRDSPDPAGEARRHVEEVLTTSGLDGGFAAHCAAWAERWRAADLEVPGDEAAQQALRFAIYHLISAANPADEHSSIGARGLSGPGYKGHVFWDTEIFILPFFTLTWPAAARALLMYRYHTLPAARAKAARIGHRGALFAWESADTGEEVTPPYVLSPGGEVVPIHSGSQEQHIAADVAYGVWSYWQATGDDAFVVSAGAEILLETARFWASRATAGSDGLLHIERVIGPDEYHDGVDDNAYTNVMAQWNLERGAEVAQWMAQRYPAEFSALARRLGLSPDEPRAWMKAAPRLYTGFDPKTGLFEQFRGYFALEDIRGLPLAGRAAPAGLLWESARVRRSQLVKQADVVMLIHLLWDRFSPEVRAANFRYYEPRTDHGSSLSPP
ncbi:MAG: Maltose phosphorylase, partial [Myxococcaceae bacterium]|nr:Maltose phosphorylase [Myxococcaceae bacterium]